MERFKKILVALDTRLDDHPIVAEAAEIAQRNDATLTLVDVAPALSWATKLTVSDHEHVYELIVQEKREKLDGLQSTLQSQGLQVAAKVFCGQTSVEIIREVLRGGHDLVMRVAKGKDSLRRGVFGNTGMRLLQQCPCAVWLVTASSAPKFKHVLACVDTSSEEPVDDELNNTVCEFASSISRYHFSQLSLVHAWPVWTDPLICKEVDRRLDRFLSARGIARDNRIHLLKGDPVHAIPAFATSTAVDLVVLGTVARSGLAGFVMGNTAEQILDRIECSVLALKPASFRSPVRPAHDIA